jgi:hypothetical protein
VPLGKVYVDLTVDEVLDACNKYINNKKFEKDLADAYNDDGMDAWDYWSEGDIL